MVETTRGAGFTGAGISTGCSSRETSFSPELASLAFACSDAFGLGLGTILFGPSSALMIGGSEGSIELPNIARYANAPAVPSTANPSTAATTTNPLRRRPLGASSSWSSSA